jgi:hypothetical protein
VLRSLTFGRIAGREVAAALPEVNACDLTTLTLPAVPPE